MIDPHTFDGSHAAEILVDKLNEIGCKKLTKRVSHFFHHTVEGFYQLTVVDDDGIFKELIVLWRKDRLSKVQFRDDIDSFLKSIIVGISRDWIRGIPNKRYETP